MNDWRNWDPRTHTVQPQAPAAKPAKVAPQVDFAAVCKLAGLPQPVGEFRFHPTRKFRFDWAWEAQKVALEINGAVWTTGRHTRGAGYTRDMAKLNAAQLLGWRVFQVTPDDLLTVGIDTISQALKG